MKSNLFVLTNIYCLFTNKDQISSTKNIMQKADKNIIIYDYFESCYEPNKFIRNEIFKISYLNKFLITNKFKDLLNILKLLIVILFSRDKIDLYIDSCTTIIQQLFIILFKLKKYNIFALCFTLPYSFQKINYESD